MRYTFMFAVMMFAQLSHAFFLGYESTDQKTNVGLSLRLFGESEHARVQGLDLCFWDTTNRYSKQKIDDFQGLNLGIMSGCENDMSGVQGNLLVSGAKTAKGLQLGVFTVSGRLMGCQLGVWHVVTGDIDGFQLGVFNFGDGRVNGFQLGVINYVEEVNGSQLGLFNLGHVNGVQLGVCNLGSVDGLQLGLLNAGVCVNGLQLGLINYSREGVSNGAQIGLLNFKEGSWWVLPFIRIGSSE